MHTIFVLITDYTGEHYIGTVAYMFSNQNRDDMNWLCDTSFTPLNLPL